MFFSFSFLPHHVYQRLDQQMTNRLFRPRFSHVIDGSDTELRHHCREMSSLLHQVGLVRPCFIGIRGPVFENPRSDSPPIPQKCIPIESGVADSFVYRRRRGAGQSMQCLSNDWSGSFTMRSFLTQFPLREIVMIVSPTCSIGRPEMIQQIR